MPPTREGQGSYSFQLGAGAREEMQTAGSEVWCCAAELELNESRSTNLGGYNSQVIAIMT